MTTDNTTGPYPTLLSLSPLLLLVFLLAGCLSLFGDETTTGPAQVSMIIAGVVAAIIGMVRGTSWNQLEAGTAITVSRAVPIIMIILVIGLLIGLWIVAGVIPLMIYYGLLLISPDVFYLAALFLSSVVALATGSSWSTAMKSPSSTSCTPFTLRAADVSTFFNFAPCAGGRRIFA